MTNNQLIQALLTLPESIRATELAIIQLEEKRRQMEFELDSRKADLLTQVDGPINGKNAEIREAQLHIHLLPQRILIADVEKQIAEQKVQLRYLHLLHRSNLAIASMLSADTTSLGEPPNIG